MLVPHPEALYLGVSFNIEIGVFGVNEFNLFVFVKGADASVRLELVGWNDKAREYLREFFDGDIERVRGTQFGDNIAKIAYITERSVMEPDAFRGV